MARYQLKDKCLFVDATDLDGNRLPPEIPNAHVLDQRGPQAKVLKLNDTAGFIARFIVMGVDTDTVAEIVSSEYAISTTNAAAEVQSVYSLLKDFVQARTYKRGHEKPGTVPKAEPTSGQYGLDFSVNWFGGGGVSKVPL